MKRLLATILTALAFGVQAQTLVKPLQGGTGISQANTKTLTLSGPNSFTGLTVPSGQTLTLTGATVAGAPTWSSSQAITLSTAAQPNVTSLGTIAALVAGTLGVTGASTLPTIYGSSAANGDITIEGTSSATKDTSYVILQPTGGNVGIGTTTPLLKLDVAGSGRFTGSTTSVLTGSIDPTASTAVVGVGTLFTTQLVVGDRITVTGVTKTVTAIASDTSLTVDTAFTNLANDTSPDKLAAVFIARDSSNAVKMVVNDLGNVGIGTASPVTKLQINGTAAAGSLLSLERGTDTTSNGSTISFTRGFAAATDAQIGVPANTSNTFSIWTADTRAVTVDGTGNVGIGTTTPTAGSKLTVAGIIDITDATDATSATAASLKTAGGVAAVKGLWVGTTSQLVGAVTMGTLGSDVGHTDATVCRDTTSGTLYAGSGTLGICLGTSSERYKTQIATLDTGLQEIMALKPVSYYLDAKHGDPTKRLYGFTAEQGGTVLPDLMGKDAEGLANTFDYLGVVPVLVKAVQELRAEVLQLKHGGAQ